MKNNPFQYTKNLVTVLGFSACLYSCSKKDIVVDFNYPAATVGIAQAAIATVGSAANGTYPLTANVQGGAYKFVVDTIGRQLTIPLGVIKSGVDQSGSVAVNIASNTDTVTKLIAANKLLPGTVLLPSTAYTLPSNLVMEDGVASATFNLTLDLNFLLSDTSKRYAVAVSIASGKENVVNSKLSVVVVYINPVAVLFPVAKFTNSLEAQYKTVNTINNSSNATSYSWNFGDGSPLETGVAPSHKYAAVGTYIITLTAKGITGATVSSTATVVVL